MTDLARTRLTLAEAAHVAGASVTDINREIDAKVIPATPKGHRTVSGADTLYIAAVKDFRTEWSQSLRRKFHDTIVEAVSLGKPYARFYTVMVPVADIKDEILSSYLHLENSIQQFIEERSDVLAGEPVLKGTRIAVRHVANLMNMGSAEAEVVEDFDITPEQIRAALLYERVKPRKGRPRVKRTELPHVHTG